MKASEIQMDESLPHGTREGFTAGCKGSHCPGVERVGMSCRQASIRYAGDWSYRRRIDAGMSAEAIAAEDAHEGVVHQPSEDADTRKVKFDVLETVTMASSETPIKLADFGEVRTSMRVPKWAVRRVWVAIAPDGTLHGPFDSHGDSIAFVGGNPVAPVTAAPVPEKRKWRRYTDDDLAQLRELHAQGLSDTEIAREMGRPEVGQKLRSLGLPGNGRKRANA